VHDSAVHADQILKHLEKPMLAYNLILRHPTLDTIYNRQYADFDNMPSEMLLLLFYAQRHLVP
jgi:hypothetical protein